MKYISYSIITLLIFPLLSFSQTKKIGLDSIFFSNLLDEVQLLKESGDYSKAHKLLQKTEASRLTFSQSSQIKYEKIFLFFMEEKFKKVCAITFEEQEFISLKKKKEYYFIRQYALITLGRFSTSKSELLKLCHNDSNLLASVYCLPLHPEVLNQYSMPLIYVPGLKLIKMGYVGKGITSLVINLSLIVFTGYQIHLGYYITAGVTGVLPLLKFYNGGKRLTLAKSEEKNEKNERELKQKYKTLAKKVIDFQ